MTVLEYADVSGAGRVRRITAQARSWSPGRVLLSLLALLLVGLGRAAFALLSALWLAGAWCVAAVKVGWDDGRESWRQRDGGAVRQADGVDA